MDGKLQDEDYIEYCNKCKEYVINLGGHCFNDDSHIIYILSDQEREEIQIDTIRKKIKNLRLKGEERPRYNVRTDNR